MNPIGDIVIILILCACSFALGFLGGKYEIGKNHCQEKGGMYVQGADGWLCMKGEKL